MSSGINTMAACTWEDVLKPYFDHLPESRKTLFTKLLGEKLNIQYIWDCKKKGNRPFLPRFINYFKYEMSEWYHAEIAVDSEVALTFLRHPPYKNICINWKNT